MKNGLVLLKPTSINFTGTSATINTNGSVSFTVCSLLALNGVFTNDYKNYKVVFHAANCDAQMYFRFGSNGIDNSASASYVYQYIDANGSNINSGKSSTNYGRLAYIPFGGTSGGVVDVYSPAEVGTTAWITTQSNSYSSGGIGYFIQFNGSHIVNDSFDRIHFLMNTGTVPNATGRICVYGLRD